MSVRNGTGLVVMSLAWGLSYVFVAMALEGFSSLQIAFLRSAIATAALATFLAFRAGGLRAPLRDMRERPGAAIALGLLAGAAPFVFIAIGQRHVPAGLTGVLVASVPLWVAVLAFRVDRTERVDRRQALGLGIGFVGVSLVVGVEFVHTAAEAIGAAVILAGCVATGASTFVVKGQYGDMAPESRALIALLASTIMLLPVAVVSPPTELQWGPTLSVVVLAVVMTAAIMVLFHTLIMRIGSGRAALSAYLAPVFSLLAGNLLLGEPFTAGGIAGAVTIIAGVALASQPRRPLPVVLRPQPSAVSG